MGAVRTDSFDYVLPPSAIAQAAIEPRHDSRLLITSSLREIPFHGLPTLLDAGDLLVVNRTRVRAARLIGDREPSGGKTELLLTKRVDADRWEALVRPAKKVRAGTLVRCGSITAELMTDPSNSVVTVTLTSETEIEAAIADAGEIPLPPYFHGSLASPERYQTMFASAVGSSAAPTAALHFTDRVIADLTAKGVVIAEVELQIGLDTFRPMREGTVDDHVIHREKIIVGEETVDALGTARDAGRRVLAVGTTVVRALESASAGAGRIASFEGETDLFITPDYRFRVVDAVLTNFHAPRTTLIVMIAAMLGDRWRTVYEHALRDGFRFLSFGDAMYIDIAR